MFFEESHSTVGAMRVSSSTGDVGWSQRAKLRTAAIKPNPGNANGYSRPYIRAYALQLTNITFT